MTWSISYFVLFHLGFYDDEIYSCFDFDQSGSLTWSDNYDDWDWLTQRLKIV